MRGLYFDCSTGISGDMAVAAMIGLGVDTEELLEVIDGLGLEGVTVTISEVVKSGVVANDFDVELAEGNPDHDVAYLYGKEPEEHHGHHHHEHRSPADIAAIIDGSSLTENAKAIAHRILYFIAIAESAAHGIPVDEVHFHEVGAKDSIVDIVSLAFCFDYLGFDDACFSPLVEGIGTVRCQHGVLPVPVPAVVNIVTAGGLRMSIADRKGEYVTPTGAAFAAAVRTRDPPASFKIERTGIGAGKRDQEVPGLLRAMVISDQSFGRDTVIKLECNVDDCTGEMLGYTMERLFAAGAREVNFTPVYMKKDRPAWLLTVICHDAEREALEEVIFRETSTIGIRRCRMERTILNRSIVEADTPWGKVRVKVSEGPGVRRGYPEYEDVAAIARSEGVPFQEVYRAAMRSSGLRRQMREDEHPHALPEVPEPEADVLDYVPHHALGVREPGPAHPVEVDGDEQLLGVRGRAVEALGEPAAHALGARPGRVREAPRPLRGDVVGDDRREHVAVPQVVDVLHADVRPPLGELRNGTSPGLRERIAQGVVVARHRVLNQLEEDVLLRLDVPVQVGARP